MFNTVSKPEPLTPLQRCCVGVIAEFHAYFGRSPTLGELADELDLSSRSQAHRLVTNLTAKGWLRPHRPHAHFALTLTVSEVHLLAEGPVEITGAGLAHLERETGS